MARGGGGVDHGLGDVVDVAEAAGGAAVVDGEHHALAQHGGDLDGEVLAAGAVDGGGADDGHGQAWLRWASQTASSPRRLVRL